MTPDVLLVRFDRWLWRRCTVAAATRPGVRAEDLYHDAVAEFLERLDEWLQGAPTVSVEAQARTLLAYTLRHAVTRVDRRRRVEVPADGAGADREAGTPADERATDAVEWAHALAAVREATSPPCALCLLSLRLPDQVQRDDAGRAKAWRKGGANAVPRALDDAWGLYTAGRADLARRADDQRWLDWVGVAWYTEGPPETLDDEARRLAASKVQRYANRAMDDLRGRLLGEEDAS